MNLAALPRAAKGASPYRVLVVDDSAVIRGVLSRYLEADPDVTVTALAGNGSLAIDAVRQHDVEVVVLDIEMPVMDGLTALPQMLAVKPDLKVIIASTLTARGADVSLRALSIGAADYLLKPGASALVSAEAFQRELLGKIKALGATRRSARLQVNRTAPLALVRPQPKIHQPFAALAIGSSTGGPQAVFKLLAELPSTMIHPIFITQHMPPTFTRIFAEHIQRITGRPTAEAIDGELVQRGRIYVAPGDFHMLVEKTGDRRFSLRIVQSPPVNFCRPAVDPMLKSLSAAYGGRVLTVILTGMGQDGLEGCRTLTGAGGTVIAQDEATSVVWGMPGAVAKAGLCSAVLPLAGIAGYLAPLLREGAL